MVEPVAWKNLPDTSTPLTAETLLQQQQWVLEQRAAAEDSAAAAAASAAEAAAPADDQVAGLIGAPGSATRTQLDTLFIPRDLRGTYAARPAAATVPPGTIYYPTDIPEQYRSDGSTWTVVGSGGNELGHAETAATFTTTSLTAVDIPGLSVTFVAGERPVVARFTGLMWNTAAGVLARACIVIGSTVYRNIGGSGTDSRSYESSVTIRGLTPGASYTVKVQMLSVSAGTAGTGAATPGSQSSLQVVTA